MMKTKFRSWMMALWLMVCGVVHAASANGVWSVSGGGDYLLMLEATNGSALVMRINASLTSGSIFLGTRSGDVIQAKNLDGSQSVNLTIGSGTYTGTQTASTGSTTLAGSVLLAYDGGPYDGVWQRVGASDRYLVTLTVNLSGISTMLVLDTKISTSTAAATFDIITGTVSTSGTVPTMVGKSLLSGNIVSHAFKGGTPAAGFYSVLTNTRPVTTVETFDTSQILQVSTATR